MVHAATLYTMHCMSVSIIFYRLDRMQVCLCVSVSLFLPGCFANRFSFCRFFCCWNYLIGFSKIESRSGHILRRKQGGRMHDVQGIAKLVFDTVYQKTSVTAMTRAAYHNVIAYTHIHKLRIERNKKKAIAAAAAAVAAHAANIWICRLSLFYPLLSAQTI